MIECEQELINELLDYYNKIFVLYMKSRDNELADLIIGAINDTGSVSCVPEEWNIREWSDFIDAIPPRISGYKYQFVNEIMGVQSEMHAAIKRECLLGRVFL